MNRWMSFLAVAIAPLTASADEPIAARGAWEGRVDYFITGAALAVDTDGDFRVDTSAQPVPIAVSAADAPGDLQGAIVYWGGSQAEPVGGACSSGADEQITVGLPAGGTVDVTADACFCSDGGGATYDVWICHADITQAVAASGGQLVGSFTIDGYAGLIANGSTHNASAALLLVYGDDTLPPRRVAAFDGNLELFNTQEVITLGGIEVDSIPSGDLAFYLLEGDISGGGQEEVSVAGLPGGLTMLLSDAINPVTNPFNQTINTTTPVQTGVVGVDIDRFEVSPALTAMDDQVDVTISAGNDRVWLAATVIGVDLFDPAFRRNSTKSVALFVDQNADGLANPGDTLRYTIRLENDGNEVGTVDVRDPMPAGLASFTVVDAAGGANVSNATEARIDGISVPAGASRSVIIDMIVDDVPDGTTIINTASWSAPLQGGLDGQVSSVATEVHAPLVVEPDMGMGDPDMGSDDDAGPGDPDAGEPGDDAGTDPDTGGSPGDMGDSSDTGTPGGGDSGGNGPDSGPGGGPDGGGPGSKQLADSGCCATTASRTEHAPILLLLLGLVTVRRRR